MIDSSCLSFRQVIFIYLPRLLLLLSGSLFLFSLLLWKFSEIAAFQKSGCQSVAQMDENIARYICRPSRIIKHPLPFKSWEVQVVQSAAEKAALAFLLGWRKTHSIRKKKKLLYFISWLPSFYQERLIMIVFKFQRAVFKAVRLDDHTWILFRQPFLSFKQVPFKQNSTFLPSLIWTSQRQGEGRTIQPEGDDVNMSFMRVLLSNLTNGCLVYVRI